VLVEKPYSEIGGYPWRYVKALIEHPFVYVARFLRCVAPEAIRLFSCIALPNTARIRLRAVYGVML
jgi:hypothetical protein